MYQRTNAEVEMKKINREEFWEQAKVCVKNKQNKNKGNGCRVANATLASQTDADADSG